MMDNMLNNWKTYLVSSQRKKKMEKWKLENPTEKRKCYENG
jgi:hypothetical protein